MFNLIKKIIGHLNQRCHFVLFNLIRCPIWVKPSGQFFVWFNYSDDDFIEAGLNGMGYNHKSYKKIIPNCKFIKGWFQTGIFFK